MIAEYTFDSETRCWSRQDYRSIDYSDGDDLERSILDKLRQCTDVSSTSGELARHIVDWPTEYHFSKSRHNLLRPLCIGTGSHVLELGCGCGSMTRFFGESGANVTAVEGSLLRAQIAAERCRDLPNVQIVCDNLINFDISQRFDYVTLIGVLEYAPRYILEKDPIAACLKKARSFLKPNGVLVLAIENQLGLKYFNGCNEDHLGTQYYGLHGLYRDDDPMTLGRAALEQRLTAAGLPCQQFFYPFPDYKLPQVILADAALSVPGFDAAALLAGMVSGNSEGIFHPNFYENLAWRPIIENGLLPQLSNSFLVLAAASEDAIVLPESGWLASAYTTSRIPTFATETRFARSGETVVVEKRCLSPRSHVSVIDCPIGGLLHRADTVCDYIVGCHYLRDLQERMGRGDGPDSVIEWAAPWLDLLRANASYAQDGTLFLSGDWIDAIPHNFIRTAEKKLFAIDKEWSLGTIVPVSWVLVRGLCYAMELSPTSTGMGKVSLRDLILRASEEHAIPITDEQISVALRHEANFLAVVYGKDEMRVFEGLSIAMEKTCKCQLFSLDLKEYFSDEICCRDKEIARIKSTVSWRVTAPLRVLWNISRNCFARCVKK